MNSPKVGAHVKCKALPKRMVRAEHCFYKLVKILLAITKCTDYDGCDVPSWLEPAQRVGELHTLFAHEFGAEIAKMCIRDRPLGI